MAGPVLFVLAEAAITLAFLPRSVGAIVAGILFGTALGSALTWGATLLGASVAFALSRSVRDGRARALLGPARHGPLARALPRLWPRVAPWAARLDAHLERRGLLSLLYTRLIPGMPFSTLNYAAGLTRIRPRDYLIATAVGIAPGTYLLVALGGAIAHPTSTRFIVTMIVTVALAVTAAGADAALRRRRAREDRG